jgi:hypothetical protein
MARREGALAGERAHLAGELAQADIQGAGHIPQRIAQHDIDRTAQHQPGRGGALAGLMDHFAGREFARLRAGKASNRFDLHRSEDRINLFAACFGDAHRKSPGTTGGGGRPGRHRSLQAHPYRYGL